MTALARALEGLTLKVRRAVMASLDRRRCETRERDALEGLTDHEKFEYRTALSIALNAEQEDRLTPDA